MTGDNADGSTNIIPTNNMNADMFREGYKKILKSIYSPENYYKRIMTFFKEYKSPKNNSKLKFEHILALFSSAYHLGIIGKERVQFWHLLLWTTLHRRELFSLAVTLAIYGHHFRKVSELHIL
jgi:hypothetical protein